MENKTKINIQQNVQKPVEGVRKKVREQTAPRPERQRRIRRATIILYTYMGVAAVLFAILAGFSHLLPYFPIDLVITRSIQTITTPWFASLMDLISYFGYVPQVDIMIVGLGIALFIFGLRLEAIVSVGSSVSVTLMGLLIKEIIGRPRPSVDLVHVMRHLNENSFPSGHVLLYTVFFGFLAFLTFTLLLRSAQQIVLLIFFLSLIILIGPSRMYIGAHWASDVTGAYLLSSIWLILTIKIYQWAKKRFFTKQPLAPEKK